MRRILRGYEWNRAGRRSEWVNDLPARFFPITTRLCSSTILGDVTSRPLLRGATESRFLDRKLTIYIHVVNCLKFSWLQTRFSAAFSFCLMVPLACLLQLSACDREHKVRKKGNYRRPDYVKVNGTFSPLLIHLQLPNSTHTAAFSSASASSCY